MAKKPSSPPLTRKEVLERSKIGKLELIIIGDKVYNTTKWKKSHPGGELTIKALLGRDATDAFQGTHPKYVKEKYLPMYYYCDLANYEEGLCPEDIAFRKLTQDLEDEGYFETDYSYFANKLAIFLAVLAVVFYLVIYTESVGLHMLAAILLGFFWQQVAFLGHDAGHNAIFHNRDYDCSFGLLVGNFLTGISIGWWKRSHNVHHIVTNSIEDDPDIQHLPIFAISPLLLSNKVFSTFYNDYLPNNDLAHAICRYQHYIYFPIMAVARYLLYVHSILHTIGVGPYSPNEVMWNRNLQRLTLFGFYVWNYWLLAQLPSVNERIAFILISHAYAGILHIQITLSHFAMPAYTGKRYHDDKDGFLRTQLSTSMDITCPTYMDWFHGGLQFQVVHHLWSRIPRHNLRKVRARLLQLCKEHDLEFHSASFIEANMIVLKKLKETSKTARKVNSMVWEALNAIG